MAVALQELGRRMPAFDRPVVKRLCALTDQALFSLANFVLTIVLIRTYDQITFASYGIAMFSCLLAAGLYRTAIVIPVLLWPDQVFRRRLSAISAQHLGIFFCFSGAIFITDLIMHLQSASAFSRMVITSFFGISAIYISVEMDRAIAIRRFGPVYSCLISFMTSASMVALACAVFTFHLRYSIAMSLLFLIGATKTIGLNAVFERRVWRHALLVLRSMFSTSIGWGGIGSLASAMYMTVPQWILGIVAAPVHIAGFTAVRTPLQPAMIILRGFDTIDKIAFGRVDQTDRIAVARQSRRTVSLYVVVSASFVLLVSLFAQPIIRLLLGPEYLDFVPTLRLTGLAFFLLATAAPLETIVFGHRRHREYALHQLAGAVLCAIGVYPLVHFFKSEGAVLAGILGWIPPYIMLVRSALALGHKP